MTVIVIQSKSYRQILQGIIMPRIVLPVPETNESVIRPIIFDVSRQLFKLTGLPDNTTIFYPGDLEKEMQPGSSITKSHDINITPFSERVSIDIEENYEADRMLSSAVYRPENLFIFRDDRVETYIKPAYSSTEVTINFRYRAVDKPSATRWRDEIRTRTGMGRDTYLHTLTYHYLIPEEFLVILKEIHRMREAVAGYGQEYDSYFIENTTQRARQLTNMSGKQTAWGIAEKQMRVVGWFDFEGVPELGSKEDEADTWTISFSYKFKYDKPITCVMAYPLMIHNQLIKYRPEEKEYRVEDYSKSYTLSAECFSKFERGNEVLTLSKRDGIAIPSFDEFIPASVVPDTVRVFTVMAGLDIINPTLLFSLKELGDYEFSPALLALLKTEAPFMTQPLKSIFVINLYQNTGLSSHDSLQVDSNLNVYSTDVLSLRNYYHIRLSIVADLRQLSQSVLDRLRNSGLATIEIINSLDPTMSIRGLLPKILGSDYITRIALDKAIEAMYLNSTLQTTNQIKLTTTSGLLQVMKTVQTLSIQTPNV